jgi:ferredoxin-NADP reductase
MKARLIRTDQVATGTAGFAFELEDPFTFEAGQTCDITIASAPFQDEKGSSRTFSIASSPADAPRILVATRLTGSAFKRTLLEAATGFEVDVDGPFGSFVLHKNAARPAVFFAGGIGITPFRSILHDASSRQLPHPITLVYSNRTPEGAAFYGELIEIAGRLPSFRFLPTMTQADASRQPWTGERRMVSADFLRDVIGDVTAPIFYVAGPPGLVAAVSRVVLEAGADPAHLRTEEFEGY